MSTLPMRMSYMSALLSERLKRLSSITFQIRLYDLRVKFCKPIKDIQDKHDKYGYNNCLLSHDKNFLYVSDKAGSIQVLDVRRGTYT